MSGRRWQMGFNSAFNGLKCAELCLLTHLVIQITVKEGNVKVKGSGRKCGWGLLSPSARRTVRAECCWRNLSKIPFGRLGCTLNDNSSSVDATARCGLQPVEKYLSIFPYLPPTLSIFSLPAPEDLFLLLSILSWVFLFFSSLPVLE